MFLNLESDVGRNVRLFSDSVLFCHVSRLHVLSIPFDSVDHDSDHHLTDFEIRVIVLNCWQRGMLPSFGNGITNDYSIQLCMSTTVCNCIVRMSIVQDRSWFARLYGSSLLHQLFWQSCWDAVSVSTFSHLPCVCSASPSSLRIDKHLSSHCSRLTSGFNVLLYARRCHAALRSGVHHLIPLCNEFPIIALDLHCPTLLHLDVRLQYGE